MSKLIIMCPNDFFQVMFPTSLLSTNMMNYFKSFAVGFSFKWPVSCPKILQLTDEFSSNTVYLTTRVFKRTDVIFLMNEFSK